MSYLYAAYIATWAIHVAYLSYLFYRYKKLRAEIDELEAK